MSEEFQTLHLVLSKVGKFTYSKSWQQLEPDQCHTALLCSANLRTVWKKESQEGKSENIKKSSKKESFY